jgi:hypothetical protein
MPSDADAGLAVQARVSAGIGPLHQEHGVAVTDDDIGNQLLVGRIGFRDGPIQVAAMPGDRGAELPEDALVCGSDAVEIGPTGDLGAGQDKDALDHAVESIRATRKVACKVGGVGSLNTSPHRSPPIRPSAPDERCTRSPNGIRDGSQGHGLVLTYRSCHRGNKRISGGRPPVQAAGTTTRREPTMSDHIEHPSDHPSAEPSRRGQSLVEFALVLPMLLVLLLGVVDFGRVFHAGIVTESSARDAAEAAAQEYLQFRRGGAPAAAADFDRISAEALAAVCEEAERLPGRVVSGGNCTMPYAAVCVHDDPVELTNYSGCGAGALSAPSGCTELHQPWPSMWTAGMLPSVEVRVCYRFDTLFNLRDLRLPLANGLDLGSIWLEKARTFTVADY